MDMIHDSDLVEHVIANVRGESDWYDAKSLSSQPLLWDDLQSCEFNVLILKNPHTEEILGRVFFTPYEGRDMICDWDLELDPCIECMLDEVTND